MKEEISIGKTYRCSSPLLKSAFFATVEKIYELSALVTISSYEQHDFERINELNGKIVVSLQSIDNHEL